MKWLDEIAEGMDMRWPLGAIGVSLVVILLIAALPKLPPTPEQVAEDKYQTELRAKRAEEAKESAEAGERDKAAWLRQQDDPCEQRIGAIMYQDALEARRAGRPSLTTREYADKLTGLRSSCGVYKEIFGADK